MRLLHDVANLVLSRACVGCETWGMPLCADCLRTAQQHARSDGRFGWGTAYAGVGRTAVLAHKRQLVRGLAEPLGALLSVAVRKLAPQQASLVLIPIPSHRAAQITRGQDTVHAIARAALPHLHAAGYAVTIQRALERTTERPSLAGANRRERRALLAGAFQLRQSIHEPVVIVDDVITTGATMAEAARAAAHCEVLGGAAVARVLRGTTQTARAPNRAAHQ